MLQAEGSPFQNLRAMLQVISEGSRLVTRPLVTSPFLLAALPWQWPTTDLPHLRLLRYAILDGSRNAAKILRASLLLPQPPHRTLSRKPKTPASRRVHSRPENQAPQPGRKPLPTVRGDKAPRSRPHHPRLERRDERDQQRTGTLPPLPPRQDSSRCPKLLAFADFLACTSQFAKFLISSGSVH